MNPLHQRDIATLSELIRAGELSVLELVDAVIARADTVPHVYVAPMFFAARKAARDADREIARRGWRGPLHGIPFGVKDAIDVAGLPTTACSRLIEPQAARKDAPAVARLRRAGAIPLGKVHSAELCLGAPGPDDAVPWPANPFNPDYSPGGSSSGSAVGLATGLFPAALGTDTVGSVRLPAAFCGVAGLKPTDGLVPPEGLNPLAPCLDQIGPMARSVRDCALLLDALTENKCYSAALTSRLDGIRLGVDSRMIAPASVDWHRAFEDACSLFRRLGAEIRDIALSPLADYSDCGLTLMLGDAFAIYGDKITRHPEKVSPITQARIRAGASRVSLRPEVRRRREFLSERTRAAMTDIDAVILPVASGDPARCKGIAPLDYMQAPMFTTPANIAGLPAVSVRCGLSSAGLPMALQVMAPMRCDAQVLRIAHAYESATPELTACPRDPDRN